MDNSMYVNIWDYIDDDFPFQIFIGGRGTGKTYSALKGAIERGERFVFMRRTAQELELLMDSATKGEGLNPFKPHNKNMCWNIGIKQMRKNIGAIYHRVEDDGKYIYEGAPLGYALALSTIAGMRGIDISDCDDIIYDEFIPEKHVKRISGEADALNNAYETISRNRELEGRPPARLWLLANSNDIYNQIFVGWGIVNEVEKMIKKGKSDRYIKERGLAIHILPDTGAYTEAKSKTSLYRLTRGTSFESMALHNEFAYNDFSLIGRRSLTGYRPLCALDDAYIYRKKGSGEYYVCYAPAKVPRFDAKTEQDRRRFMQVYGINLLPRFIKGNIIFESYELKSKILDVII